MYKTMIKHIKNFKYNKLIFVLIFILVIGIIISSTVRILHFLIIIYGKKRKHFALKVFMSSQNYPNFYSKFGKFPTEYLNTLYTNENNKDGKIMDLSLRDFYIASAFRPYQVAGQTFDVCSYESIQIIIEKGARFHFIDIWSSNPTNYYDETAYPIVRNKTLMPRYGHALHFDKVCEIYKKYSWFGTKYPLILYLNIEFTAANNKFVLNKIAEILWKNFQGRFVGLEYSFGRKNIGDIPIKRALNNIIILSNIYPNQGHLQELINGVISDKIQNSGNLTIYDELNVTHGGIRAKSSNMQTIIDFNQTHLGIVIPGDIKNITNIYQPGVDLIQIPIELDRSKQVCDRTDKNSPYGFKETSVLNYGFNCVCINYQKPGQERDDYIDFFKESSLVLKCDKLRYIPGPKPIIRKQNKDASYAPRSIDFMKGYFSHKF